MDLWETIISLLPMLIGYIPVNTLDVITNVVGGSAIIASVFVKTDNRILTRVHKAVNIMGFNFGNAKNK